MKTVALLLFSTLLFFGQIFPNNVDSLKTVVSGLSEDTTKVKTLLEISSSLWRTEPDEAIKYADEALQLSEKTSYPDGKAKALKNIGLAYYIKSDYLNVLNYWQKSLETYQAMNDRIGIGNLLNNIGAVYFNFGDDPKALEYYLESLRVSEETGDKLRIATALTNIGAVYFNKAATHDKAESYYLKALPLSMEVNDLDAIGTSAVNLGEIYLEKEDHVSALLYFDMALNALAKTGGNESYALTNIGKSYRMQGDYAKALDYQKKAYDIAEKKEAKLGMAIALNAIGDTYFSQKKYRDALSNYQHSRAIAEELRSNTNLKEVYENLANCYAAMNDHENAFRYQGLFSEIKDTLYNVKNDRRIESLQFQFDIEKKEAEIEILNKENELKESQIKQAKILRNFLLAAAVFLLVTIGGVTYQYQFAKKTNKIIIEERNKSDQLLLNILPTETAEELKQYGSVKAKQYDFVSVLFTDFKAFTKHVETITPEELVKSIDYYFKGFDDIFEKYNLEKIKTIGDSYMCAGGLPIANKTNPEDAIKAGLDIIRFVEDLKKTKPAGIHIFEVRIGISTGPVIAGVVGKTKFQYDIWGDAVNVASRMETSCEVGKVNISEFTYEHVKDKFSFEFRGNIEVKNRGKIKMYYVEGVKA
ncbi:MAG: tetratricopeptide repeat protein [Saprospiraceae bacterium]